MIRFLSRFFGALILAAAFVFVVYDGAKSIADNAVHISRLGRLWADINPDGLQSVTETYLAGRLWNPVVTVFLDQPVWLILGVGGIALVLLGRKKKPLIGYARD